jgi:WD40 repeat protein
LALSADGFPLAPGGHRRANQDLGSEFWSGISSRQPADEQLDNVEIVVYCGQTRSLVIVKEIKGLGPTGKTSERQLGTTLRDFSLLKFSHDGRLLALCEAYTVKIFDVTSGRELPTLNVPNNGIVSYQAGGLFAGFSDDGRKIATGGFGTQTLVWETETGKQLLQMKGRSNMAYEVAFSADGSQLLSGGRTRWDLRTGRGLRVTAVQSSKEDKVFAVPSPDGHLLAQFTANSSVVTLRDTTTGRQLQALDPAAAGAAVQRVSTQMVVCW